MMNTEGRKASEWVALLAIFLSLTTPAGAELIQLVSRLSSN